MKGQRQHIQYANKLMNRRLELKTDRPDFMTPFMKNNFNFENMSRDEILSTFNFIIVGGSETTATTLTGIFNHLSRSERILQRLCTEIRTKLKRETDITIDNIHDLPYLEAVLNEGLRMCNPIPGGLPRVVPEGGDTYAGDYLPGGVSNPFYTGSPTGRIKSDRFNRLGWESAHLQSTDLEIYSLTLTSSFPNVGYRRVNVLQYTITTSCLPANLSVWGLSQLHRQTSCVGRVASCFDETTLGV